MTKYNEDYAQFPSFAKFADNGQISIDFGRYLDELVNRLNFSRVVLIDAANPNGLLEGDKTQLSQDSTGDLWIKTTDGGNTGWVKVGTQI